MTEALYPASASELSEAITCAAQAGQKLRIEGGGSKDTIGAPTPGARTLHMSQFTGVIDYDPPELVLTAKAGTPLSEIELLVASEEQMLAFDPFDHGPLLGAPAGRATIGGIIAAGVSGSGRLSCGAVRDHLLGFEAVSGDGAIFKAGAKVVKNVTGFDLSKLVTGSWGRLAAITEVTLKVVPRPRSSRTLLLHGLDPAAAVAMMARALGSACELSAAAYLPAWPNAPAIAFRLDGFPPSVHARTAMLAAIVGPNQAIESLDATAAAELWQRIRRVDLLPIDQPLWRIVIPPSKAPGLLTSLEDAKCVLDWAGGLVWAATSVAASRIRASAAAHDGHATLVRAAPELRAAVSAFHPQPDGIEVLESKIRRAFDPDGVFECGRF